MNRPFNDLLIADISGTIATGYAGKLFSDYGARVEELDPF
jgi:crotonobetainyl-CoA:carnitine CoA-transferase CaiB-like acyl-CoA transferase